MNNMTELYHKYRQYEKLHEKMQATVLEIMGLPDVTANQVMEVQQAFASHCKRFREIRRKMRELGVIN